jgi:uncharacterized protein involved in exopolysaccharide biosynthesis
MNMQEKEISFLDVLKLTREVITYLFKKWILITAICLITAACGLYMALKAKYNYTATLSFVVEDDKVSGGLGGALGIASQFGLDFGNSASGGVFNGANLLELMKSRSLIEKTLLEPIEDNGAKKNTLADLYAEMQKIKNDLKGSYKVEKIINDGFGNRISAGFERDSLITIFHKQILSSNLKISLRDKKASIIDIKVVSSNESFSQKFTEKLIDVVSRFYIDTKTKKTSYNISILQKQVDSVRNELDQALGGVSTITDATFNLNPAFTKTRLPSQKRQIDVQANTAILTELVKNLEIAKIDLRRETPLIQIVDKPVLPLLKEKLGKKKGVFVGGLIGFIGAISFLAFSYFINRFNSDKIQK